MCLNPRPITHPSLRVLCGIKGFTMLHTPDGDFPYSYGKLPYDIDPKSDPDNINRQYYVYNPTTGEVHPLVFFAPCSHCSECVVSKYSELAARLQFEALSHDSNIPVIFFTLTYDNAHLPKNGVQRAHITDFVNKLHIYLKRVGINSDFRHFIVSEYGTDPRYTRRPHYHGLIFGLDLRNYGHVKLFNKIIHRCWKRCTYKNLKWEFARSNHALSRYVCKYIVKQRINTNCVPPGKNPNFYSSPRVGGGLGAPALRNPDILDKILHSFDGTISVKSFSFTVNGMNTFVQKIRIPRFLIDKLFPPICRYFTSNIRRALQWLVHAYNHACRVYFDVNKLRSPRVFFKKLSLFFFRKDFFGFLNTPAPLGHTVYFSPYTGIEQHFLTNYNIIYDYLLDQVSKLPDYRRLYARRSSFLSKLLSNIPKKDFISPDIRLHRNNSFLHNCLKSSTLDASLKI